MQVAQVRTYVPKVILQVPETLLIDTSAILPSYAL